MTLSWLMEKFIIDRPTRINMGTKAFQEYVEMVGKMQKQPGGTTITGADFCGAQVLPSSLLSPNEIEFVAAVYKC